MDVVLYDPDRRLTRLIVDTWFKARFTRAPQRIHQPGDFGAHWSWWHIGYITRDEAAALPTPPLPPGDNPYRDLPHDTRSPLFLDILQTQTGAWRRFRLDAAIWLRAARNLILRAFGRLRAGGAK